MHKFFSSHPTLLLSILSWVPLLSDKEMPPSPTLPSETRRARSGGGVRPDPNGNREHLRIWTEKGGKSESLINHYATSHVYSPGAALQKENMVKQPPKPLPGSTPPPLYRNPTGQYSMSVVLNYTNQYLLPYLQLPHNLVVLSSDFQRPTLLLWTKSKSIFKEQVFFSLQVF